MAHTFLPKSVEITGDVIKRLKEEFGLNNDELMDVDYWNGPSPYGGTILNTDPKAQYKAYPMPGGKEAFMAQYPDGKIWE